MLTGFDPGKAIVGPGNVSSLSTGWAQATGNSVESSSAVVKGHVYAGSGDGKVYVLEPAAGAVIWDPHRGCVSSSPPGWPTASCTSGLPMTTCAP